MPATDAPLNVTFSDLKLSTSLLIALEGAGYERPTPVQEAVIPHALARHDVMVMAKTGSGKTAAFSLPILQLLLPYANKSTSPAHHPVQALILAPTRELATQIYDNLQAYAQITDLRTLSVVGGVDMNPQIAEMKRGVEVVVATVGRLLDHLRNKTINLEAVRFLVLDECDRMLDMGFLPDLTEILKNLPAQRQNLLFSATLTPDIRKLANTYLRHPIELNISEDIEVSDTVRHEVLQCEESQKFRRLVHILRHRATHQAIVFLNTKRQTRTLAKSLTESGVISEAINGDMSQYERDSVLGKFRDKTLRVLVATDVAARGLDIPALPLVMNFSPPHAAVEYVHRVGRTGRAGLSGEAITLCAKDELMYLAEIEKLLGQKIPPYPMPAGWRDDAPPTRTESPRPYSSRRPAPPSSYRGNTPKAPPDPLIHQPYQPENPNAAPLPPSAPFMAQKAKSLPALLRKQ